MTDPCDEDGELVQSRLLIPPGQFNAIVRDNFVTDGLDDDDMVRLYEGWVEIANNPKRFWGQESMFEPENAGRLHGVGWWESFMVAEEDPEFPKPGVEEHVMMYVSSTPVTGYVPPRFYCPTEVVGTWILVAEGNRHEGELPPAPVRHEMVLRADGSFRLSERTTDETARWCVHKASLFDELWFRDPVPPHRHEWHIVKKEGDDLTTELKDLRNILRRWTRAENQE
jgi:hypothetical protein